ncbi:dimethyl sulfoxide reductase anchor subunit [soil metagenome]
MRPAYSVIFFTTASGAGYGLLALLGLVGFNHGPASSFAFGAIAIVIALGLISAGLLSSTFHLGRPERAWRAFSQWRSSWLSREGVVSVITYAPALAFGIVWLKLIDAPALIAPLGLLTALLCAVTVYCTARIYSSLATIRQWHNALTAPVYLAFALATGSALLLAIAAPFGRWQIFLALFTIVSLLAVTVLKALYWRGIDREERTHTMEAATGLGRIGSVRQWEVPHTAENFIMKEMGYHIARKHAVKLRSVVLMLLAAAALAALLSFVPLVVIPFSVLCAILAGIAAIVERWLFFAEAQHVVSLYYGAASA